MPVGVGSIIKRRSRVVELVGDGSSATIVGTRTSTEKSNYHTLKAIGDRCKTTTPNSNRESRVDIITITLQRALISHKLINYIPPKKTHTITLKTKPHIH